MNKISIKNRERLDSHVVEAFDMLRTNIEFAGNNVKTLVVTSACAKEGKSLIAFQLAGNLADNDKRTLLVMCDYRKGVSGKSSNVIGITETLTGKAGLNDSVYKTDIQNLYMMFSGENIANADQLVSSSAFEKMVAVLKKKFDYVIFDTEPVLDSNITSILCSKCDGTILIMEQEKTRQDVVFAAKEQIELAGGNILGAVLNNPV